MPSKSEADGWKGVDQAWNDGQHERTRMVDAVNEEGGGSKDVWCMVKVAR